MNLSAEQILAGIEVMRASTRLLRQLGVNYAEVAAAQQRADDEDRELSDAELQSFIDQAQDRVDQL